MSRELPCRMAGWLSGRGAGWLFLAIPIQQRHRSVCSIFNYPSEIGPRGLEFGSGSLCCDFL